MQLYTVEEARALLPQVLPVLEQLRDSIARLRRLRTAVEASARGATADGHLLADPWADEAGDPGKPLRQVAREALKRLEAWGIEVKDAERGLIDFYHRREGELVYLCYLPGEPTVDFWHPLDAGFAGRQPIGESSDSDPHQQ
jgi:hypothetical protein